MNKGKNNAYTVYERIDFMKHLLKSGKSFSLYDITNEFEISRATFFRDLMFMRERLNLNIVYEYGEYKLDYE